MNDKLKKPDSDEILGRESFSITGKTVNLYNALLYASIYKEKNPENSLKKFKSKYWFQFENGNEEWCKSIFNFPFTNLYPNVYSTLASLPSKSVKK